MNLFLVGADPVLARQVVRELAEELPYFPGCGVELWQGPELGAAWISHLPEQTGAVAYAHQTESELVLWSGRPFRWVGETSDGMAPIEPLYYARPASEWSGEVDGRAAVVTVLGGAIEAYSDPLGSYPLYEAGGWISNSAQAAARAAGVGGTNQAALASLLGGGWSLSGDPLLGGVRRLPAGVHRPGTSDDDPLLDDVNHMLGAGLDAAAAARVLVAAVRALGEWPGRPNVVPVTGGRDARVVLAAALEAGIDFETQTGGAEDAPDVRVGRALAETAGVPHSLFHEPGGYAFSDWRRASRLIELMSGGTACLADAAGYPMGPREGALVLWHTGQGGEIARAYYGHAGRERAHLSSRLYDRFTGRRTGRADLLNAEGSRSVLGQIEQWVGEKLDAGTHPRDVPDLFYLEKRMGTWAGPSHGCQEYVRDPTSAFWSRRLLPHALALPARERAAERFHLHLLEELRPDLIEIPFGDGGSWKSTSRIRGRASKAMTLQRKARGALRRRLAARAPAAAHGAPPTAHRAPEAPPDHFAQALPEIREQVLQQPQHDAWTVLDKPRVERLLAAPPGALDEMSRYYVWRLAQVFTR